MREASQEGAGDSLQKLFFSNEKTFKAILGPDTRRLRTRVRTTTPGQRLRRSGMTGGTASAATAPTRLLSSAPFPSLHVFPLNLLQSHADAANDHLTCKPFITLPAVAGNSPLRLRCARDRLFRDRSRHLEPRSHARLKAKSRGQGIKTLASDEGGVRERRGRAAVEARNQRDVRGVFKQALKLVVRREVGNSLCSACLHFYCVKRRRREERRGRRRQGREGKGMRRREQE